MKLNRCHIVFVLFIALLFNFPANGQFYNGHQMTFGKNRVQFNDFYWQYLRYPKFDVYFYVNGRELAGYVAKIANTELEMMEYSVEEFLQHRVIFIVYNKQSEFRQSNIGLVSGNDEYNIGGVTRIIDNKVFVYFEGDHVKLRRQIKASLAEVLINEMMYGGNLRERVSSSATINLPEWYVKGLISYLAYDDDFETEAKIKEAILNEKCHKIHRMQGNDARIAGHAFWRYLSETYGPQIIPQIIYMTRVTRNLESGFLYVLGSPMKDMVNDWFYYYQGRYQDEISEREDRPTDAKAIVKKGRKNKVYSQVKGSPNGRYIAYTTNHDGRYKIHLYNTITNKTKCLYRKENKLEQIVDYSYPILAWQPNGNVITWMRETNGHIWLDLHNIETGETQHREIFTVDKVLDYAYSPDGLELVMSAVDNGYTDIFIYSVIASSFKRLTRDLPDDLHPRFIGNSNELVFSSNRLNDSLEVKNPKNQQLAANFDLWIYALNDKNPSLKRLTATRNADELYPSELGNLKYLYLSNANGINNPMLLAVDSTISFIDTAIHYQKFNQVSLLGNRKFTINSLNYNPFNKQITEITRQTKRPFIYTYQLNTQKGVKPTDNNNTWFRDYVTEKSINDSLDKVETARQKELERLTAKTTPIIEDSLININNYIFEIEKEEAKAYLATKEEDQQTAAEPKQLIHTTNFYSNLLVTQVDFGFMNQSYQYFTGGEFYYNPGMNLLTKFGAIDIFEDYKITGGIRFSMNLTPNEYLISVENLKYRVDRQYIYHRQIFNYSLADVNSNELMAVIKYPISQIQSFKFTGTVRLDELVVKSLENYSLQEPNQYSVWNGLKLEYIIDNTRSLGLNLPDGFRAKIFGEYYLNLNDSVFGNLFVIGADARYYLPLYRGIIFASRFATSTSFGNSGLIYYLGAVDNWMNFSQRTPTFDYSTRINQDKNWAFQAVATNMRGFVQNVRNGNSFALTNFELRWPVIRFLYNRPVSSDFLTNLMVVGFTDIGTAWEGWNPLKAKNAYDFEEINQKPVTVIIDRKKSPLVAGVGFGLRSRLLGYYVRTDWAWGIDGGRVLPRVFYLSLCTDF